MSGVAKKSLATVADKVKAQNVVVVDSEESAVKQVGTWTSVAHKDAAHLTYLYSNSPGDYLTYEFRGTGIWVRIYLRPDAGKAKVSIDGGTPVTVDLYASVERLHILFVHSNLSPGVKHTIKIEVDSTKNAASSDYKVAIDSFIVELSRGAMQIWAMIETAIETIRVRPFKSEIYGAKLTVSAAGSSSKTFAASLVGGKDFNAISVATNVAEDGDYYYVEILDADDNVVHEPVDAANPIYFFGSTDIEFANIWDVKSTEKIKVTCYGASAKSFFVAIEMLARA